MQLRDALFSSESVTEGHPDKVCDQVSDAVLDECLRQDKSSRVALETAVKTGLVLLIGEITTRARLDYSTIVRRSVERIGFNDGSMGFDSRSCAVMVAVEQQSPEIAMGVDSSAAKEQGAGDQGMMFGYACDETPELMPLPIALAHRLTRQLAKARRGELKWLRPDGKSQVTVEYRGGRPHKVQAVVIAAQHDDSVSTEHLREAINSEVIDKVVPVELRGPLLGMAIVAVPALLAVLALSPQAARAVPKAMTARVRPIKPTDSLRVFMRIASLAGCGGPQGGPAEARGIRRGGLTGPQHKRATPVHLGSGNPAIWCPATQDRRLCVPASRRVCPLQCEPVNRVFSVAAKCQRGKTRRQMATIRTAPSSS